MQVKDVVIGDEYHLVVRFPPVSATGPRARRRHWGWAQWSGSGRGMRSFKTLRTVKVVEKVGQHFIAEAQVTRCERDMKTWEITKWWRETKQIEVYARQLIPLDPQVLPAVA